MTSRSSSSSTGHAPLPLKLRRGDARRNWQHVREHVLPRARLDLRRVALVACRDLSHTQQQQQTTNNNDDDDDDSSHVRGRATSNDNSSSSLTSSSSVAD
jgi:hypothetical protein